MASYADWQQTLTVTAGEAQQLETVTLKPAPGLLELASVPGWGQRYSGRRIPGPDPPDPGGEPGPALTGWRYSNRATGATTARVELPAAGSDSQTVTLRAQLGEVRFGSARPKPSCASTAKCAARAARPCRCLPSNIRWKSSLPGYATVRQRVTPRPGLQQLVEARLKTQQEARLARIKPEITTALGQTLRLFNPAESGLAGFSMGASRREPGRRANEVLHPVSLRRMFYLQTTEVTNAQFRQFQGGHNSGQVERNSLNRDHQPVAQVSWQQAASFCNWLSKREGLPLFYREANGIIVGYNPSATGYRLPSEAEWAWAARANGAKLIKFPWGDLFPPTTAVENYADNSSAQVTGRVLNGYNDGQVVSAPVASYAPNQHGLYDMGGNVAEWVHDVYSIPSANGATQVDPLGAQNGDNYVIRGASWSHSRIAELRLSYRDYGQAGRDDVGFRLARYAE